jgi:outer membrane lipoprotein SlyB
VSFLRLVMSAALAGGIACGTPLGVAGEPVRGAVAPVIVDGVDVEQVAALGAGVPLEFTVFGTAGALVTLRIEGARRILELRETEPGVYEGSYLIGGGDSIRPESRVTATLQKNGAVAYAALDEPLLLAKGTVPWGLAATPAESPPPAPALVSPSVPPVAIPVPQSLPAETTIPVPIAVAPRQAQPVRSPRLAATTPPSDGGQCGDCAVVESVRAVEIAPRGGVIGTIGGAIAGAILGKELGEAHKQRMLTVLGAIGGALAGRQIERQGTRSVQYDVELRLADGTLLKRRYEQPPPFAAGATIRLGTPARVGPAPAL